jgi:CxxC motif-containing protein (DUF1111 family)
MRQKFIAVLVLLVAIVVVGLAGLAQDTPAEAPAGFDTPTLAESRLSRGTKVPPRDAALAQTTAAQAGQIFFERLGCSTCHVGTIVTVAPGTVINGGMFAVPETLGNQIIHPYSDFLLHDIETGDGIVQAGPQGTANKLRSAPLWGLRMRPRFMQDLRSLSLQNAIERHAGEAEHVRQRFQELSPVEKQQLFSFSSVPSKVE